MEKNVVMEAKPIDKIKGTFNIPAYQRGYRWEKFQVKTLLNDLWQAALNERNGFNDYCLQPIVVLKKGESLYDLIDGQQRLTTLYVLLNYIKQYYHFIQINFNFEYETRKNTQTFLDNMDEEKAQTNIDFYHLFKAREAITEWLEEKFPNDSNEQAIQLNTLYQYIFKHVKVIWYEVEQDIDPIALFTRLNIGKIQLTNAELIRALFLISSNNEIDKRKQFEIATQWDYIEKQLHADKDEFWSFISRKDPSKYATRIELLFDLMFDKKEGEKDSYFTFFKAEALIKQLGKSQVWTKVIHNFLQIKEWYTNNTYYHKIGYLIASGHKTMAEIINEAKGKRKSEFNKHLDALIAQSITWNTNDKDSYWDLDYNSDYGRISKILLLFNIQSIIRNDADQRFSFSKYNRAKWSLEHIHAQKSEGLNTAELQLEWLKWHLPSLKSVYADNPNNELVVRIKSILKCQEISGHEFDFLFNKVMSALSENNDNDYIHSLSNMALLNTTHNTCLSNSAFDVKRDLIISMDKKGEFIPLCTKKVFLKYYTHSINNQVHFWGKADRDAYLEAIKETLRPYYQLIDFKA